MKSVFEKSNSTWVKYNRYEIKTAKDGKRYVTAAKDATPEIYDPLEKSPQIVLDALNTGLLMMGGKAPTDPEVEQAVMDFVSNYGLLGLMTALPTTPSFMDYEAVYLMKNQFITEEAMETLDYIDKFFPFEKLDLVKKGLESSWSVGGDNTMVALAMTFINEPTAKAMSFQRQYAEPYEWVALQLKDWAFTLLTPHFYYKDFDVESEAERILQRKAMAAFGGIAPTYHIELLDKPTICWDFHSLLLGIQMLFSFMLVNEKNPMQLCDNCHKVFLREQGCNGFCSRKCEKEYNK